MRSTFIKRFLSWLNQISGVSEKKEEKAPIEKAAPERPMVQPKPAEPVAQKPAEPVAQKPADGKKAPLKKPAEKAQEKIQEPETQPDVHDVKAVGSWEPPAPVRENEGDILFQDFPLDKKILRALLEDLQFTKCTPIQGMVLPHALAGEDMAGKAQTGTGKTAAFLITMLQHFLKAEQGGREANQPFALALAPTRELAIQIAHDANALCAYCHFNTVAVYGGMDYERQRRLLQSHVDFIVATPGRLIDFLESHVVSLDNVQVLVIDEADRMLDMGFIPDVKRIVSRLGSPDRRQTMLFSATLNHDIMNLASRWMRPNPAVLEAAPEHIVAEGVDETVYAVTAAEKLPVLLWTLRNEDCHRVLIFRNRRSEVEALHDDLQRFGISSEMLSGDVDQKKRLRILEDFKVGKVKVIVATDVAGRGIHVDDVTHVINFDFPYEAEDYVHRVGRTARAGHKGRAISFADEESAFVVPDIETYIGRPLPITQPEEEMLKWPEELKGIAEKLPSKSGSGRRSGGGQQHHGGHGGSGPRRRGGAPGRRH